LLFLGTGEKYQVSPSSSGTITVDGCEMSKSLLGIITVDINGEEEPNTPYKDQFNFPISSKGIEYEMMCQEVENAQEELSDCALAAQQAVVDPPVCSASDITASFCASLGNGWVFSPEGPDPCEGVSGSCGGVIKCASCENPCGFSISCCGIDIVD
ncbi:MAG: hypothetical protein IJB79_03260, partial [Candidatus Gastranaerophilales bacterium]|nr:hypothetical protein [Candidatus Gastranaerophilales bacterium]